eukprot:m.176599 g.176599  ORF g.176599 m.176599 type:complete len:225 (+) comp15446_c0_seq6:40-714(+)
MMLRLVILSALFGVTQGLDNGLGRTPQMGYNSWYDLECTDDMNERVIRQTALAMVSNGLVDVGYNYINLDDCFISHRAPNTNILVPDPSTFPSGMRALADFIHNKSKGDGVWIGRKGMKFGVYTDRGPKTCAGRPAAQGYEILDAETYANWTVDYLKEDSCDASQDHETAIKDYGRMRDALNKTGRAIFFSLCGWNSCDNSFFFFCFCLLFPPSEFLMDLFFDS